MITTLAPALGTRYYHYMHQNINFYVAIAAVAAVGIAAVFIILRVANATEFSYINTDESITIMAEFQKKQAE